MSSIGKISELSFNQPKIETQESSNEVFSQVFNQILSGKEVNSQNGNDLSSENIDDIISNSQQILFGGLGLAIPESGSFENIDSAKLEESVTKMQDALISSLKSSVQIPSVDGALNDGDGVNQVLLSFVGDSTDMTAVASAENGLSNLDDATSTLSSMNELAFGENGAGTEDVIDTVNPLNHIPIVSNIYQAATGAEEPSPAAKILGSGLIGGPLGAGVAAAGVGFEYFSGIELSELLPWSSVTGEVTAQAKDTYDSLTDTITGE